MDLIQPFDAILFPADNTRRPRVVSLMTSPASFSSNSHAPAQTSTARVPHPEVHMEYIAQDPNTRAWHYEFVEALDMMNKKFAKLYIIFYPIISRDGMPFPVNETVKDIQKEMNNGQRLVHEDQLWRGNLVAAKFADDRFTQMIDTSMADFPIIKNFLRTHPLLGSASALPTSHPAATLVSPMMTHPTHPSPYSSSSLHTPRAPLPSPSHSHPASLQSTIPRQMQFVKEPTSEWHGYTPGYRSPYPYPYPPMNTHTPSGNMSRGNFN